MFGGIGGFDLALIKNGWECVGYYEIDKYATQVYNKNFGTKYKPTDITTVNAEDVPDHDLLVGGFPCQSFSIAGKRKGFNDTRGTLFFDIARILKEKRPEFILLENVKGLLSHDNGRTFWTVLRTLDELGYCLQWEVLNSKNFGVAQNRERVFIVGCLGERSGFQIFPFGKNPEKVSGIQGQTVNTLTSKKGTNQSDGDYIIIEDKQQTQTAKRTQQPTVNTLTAGGHSGGHHSSMTLICSQKVKCLNTKGFEGLKQPYQQDRIYDVNSISTSLTSLKNNNIYIKKSDKLRRLTPTEWERLQSFPDNWAVKGFDAEKQKSTIISDAQRYKQLGNAVTVNVVEEIIKKINKLIE